MRFKGGDIVKSCVAEPGTDERIYVFNHYFTNPYLGCVDCLIAEFGFSTSTSNYSTGFWFAEGRHVLTELTRKVRYEI